MICTGGCWGLTVKKPHPRSSEKNAFWQSRDRGNGNWLHLQNQVSKLNIWLNVQPLKIQGSNLVYTFWGYKNEKETCIYCPFTSFTGSFSSVFFLPFFLHWDVRVKPTSCPCWLTVVSELKRCHRVTALSCSTLHPGQWVPGQIWRIFMDWLVEPFACSTSWAGCWPAHQRLTLTFPPLNPLWLNICWLI